MRLECEATGFLAYLGGEREEEALDLLLAPGHRGELGDQLDSTVGWPDGPLMRVRHRS